MEYEINLIFNFPFYLNFIKNIIQSKLNEMKAFNIIILINLYDRNL